MDVLGRLAIGRYVLRCTLLGLDRRNDVYRHQSMGEKVNHVDVFGLEIDQVGKTIDGKTIVHPFSLRIEPGEVIALCGGNGAGKSTILRM